MNPHPLFDENFHPVFKLVKTQDIPSNIKRLQEKSGFKRGEPLTKGNLRRLIPSFEFEKLKQKRHANENKENNGGISGVNFQTNQRPAKRRITIEEYRNNASKIKNHVNEKISSNCGVIMFENSGNRTKKGNLKSNLDETDPKIKTFEKLKQKRHANENKVNKEKKTNQRPEKRRITIEEYRYNASKIKNPVNEKISSNSGEHMFENSENRTNKENVKKPLDETDPKRTAVNEKFFSNWSVRKIENTLNRTNEGNVKDPMEETELRRAIMKRKFEEELIAAKRVKMTDGERS